MPTVADERPPALTFEGIYQVPEAARYLRAAKGADRAYPVNSAKLTRWIRRGLAAQYLPDSSGRSAVIAFEDLVSMRVIAVLRTAKVPWSEIDRTERWLREHTGARRPFAMEYLWPGQGQLFAEWGDHLVSGSRHGQMALDVLREYVIPVHDLVFSPSSQVATSWEPFDGVVLQPQVQFGAPCIKGTRIPTRAISGMIEAGDSEEWVQEAYNISKDEVRAAREWESRLQHA